MTLLWRGVEASAGFLAKALAREVYESSLESHDSPSDCFHLLPAPRPVLPPNSPNSKGIVIALVEPPPRPRLCLGAKGTLEGHVACEGVGRGSSSATAPKKASEMRRREATPRIRAVGFKGRVVSGSFWLK